MPKMFRLIALLPALPVLLSCETVKEFDYRSSTPVRVTELHFDCPSDQGDAEFVEIANVSDDTINVAGWEITGAGRLALPAGSELKPREALVICRDPQSFQKAFSGVTPVATFTGKLSNKGETIRIEDPDGLVADEVEYDDNNPEVAKASGTGLSIHRLKGSRDNVTWRAAEPSPGKFGGSE